MLLTAIIDEDTVLVMAMKMSTRRPVVAPLPRRDIRTYGMTKPELTCVSVRVVGYIHQTGVFSMARAARPTMVPVHHGTAMMTTETMSYAGTVDCTSEANDFCQKAVSISTRARLPNFRTRPKRTATPIFISREYET